VSALTIRRRIELPSGAAAIHYCGNLIKEKSARRAFLTQLH
jgi:hypothetical protein